VLRFYIYYIFLTKKFILLLSLVNKTANTFLRRASVSLDFGLAARRKTK